MPEFQLKDRVILVSGGARGLGLTQAEALMEAGATGIYFPMMLVLSYAALEIMMYSCMRILEASTDVYRVIVYVLDRLPEPSDEFFVVQKRAREELGTDIHYRKIDVTKDAELREIVHAIGEKHGRLDGLIAAAGINKEGDSLEYTIEGKIFF